MRIDVSENRFADSQKLADALAGEIAARTRRAIDERGKATLVLPGGNSPRRFLTRLGEQPLDWARVTVTLTDERQVPADNQRANARLLRDTLFLGTAAAANFVPLYAQAADGTVDAAHIEADIGALPLPFDAVVLGMGTDGHCASLFPDADRLADALRADAGARVMPIQAPSAGEPRVTLTLAALVDTRSLYLHIEGDAKRRVLDRVLRGESAPVGDVLRHAGTRPQIYWCL